MEVFIPDRNALDEAISQALDKHLENKLISLIRKANRKEWLNTSEVMQITGWSKRTIQYLRDQNRIKFHQEGHRILYRYDDLDEYLESIGVEPRNPDLD